MVDIKILEIFEKNIDETFNLIIDVDNYEKIISFIKKSKIINKIDENNFTAKTTISQKKLQYSYNSVIKFEKNHSITIKSEDRIFTEFFTEWKFSAINEKKTLVLHRFKCKLGNKILNKLLESSVKKNINEIIGSFKNYLN